MYFTLKDAEMMIMPFLHINSFCLRFIQLNDVIRNGDIFSYEVYKGFLRMDGQTLVNLEIFNNNADGSQSGK